jgi:YD repeat-containing protein
LLSNRITVCQIELHILRFNSNGNAFGFGELKVNRGIAARSHSNGVGLHLDKQRCPHSPSAKVGVPNQTGNKLQVEIDYHGQGQDATSFARYYNSLAIYTFADGKNWRNTYSRSVVSAISLTANGITGAGAIVYRPPGYGVLFVSQQGQWLADADVVERLQQTVDSAGNPTGWLFFTANDEIETYDATGRLISIMTRAGTTQTLAYDALGRLSTVTDAFGRRMSFNYDASGNLVSMTSPDEEIYQYGYDASNRLVSVTYPDNTAREYLYNEPAYVADTSVNPNVLTGILDENNNRFAAFFYDAAGRAVSTLHYAAPGQSVDQYTVNYLNVGVSAVVSDPLGTQRSYGYANVVGVVKGSSVTQPCSGTGCSGTVSNAATYDSNGNLSRTTDFNGKSTCYAYDPNRNLETARVEGLLSTESCSTSLASPPNRPDVRAVAEVRNGSRTEIRATPDSRHCSAHSRPRLCQNPRPGAAVARRTQYRTFDAYREYTHGSSSAYFFRPTPSPAVSRPETSFRPCTSDHICRNRCAKGWLTWSVSTRCFRCSVR